MEFIAMNTDVLMRGKTTRKNVIGAEQNLYQKIKTRYTVLHLVQHAITVNNSRSSTTQDVKGLKRKDKTMHLITDKLIRSAVEYLLEGRYEKPKEKQIKTVSTMGIYDASTSERAMAAVSPVIQTSY